VAIAAMEHRFQGGAFVFTVATAAPDHGYAFEACAHLTLG